MVIYSPLPLNVIFISTQVYNEPIRNKGHPHIDNPGGEGFHSWLDLLDPDHDKTTALNPDAGKDEPDILHKCTFKGCKYASTSTTDADKHWLDNHAMKRKCNWCNFESIYPSELSVHVDTEHF